MVSSRTTGSNALNTLIECGCGVDGCVLLEEYSAANGAYTGKSSNYYDDADGKWHQVWDVSEDGGATWNAVFGGLYTKQ